MTRLRLVIPAVIAAVAAALSLPVGANAATPNNSATQGSLTLTIQYQPDGGGAPVGLDPNNPFSQGGVDVVFWKLDTTTQYYSPVTPTGSWTGSIGAVMTSPDLDPGTYRLEFIPYDQTVGQLYYSSTTTPARYFYEGSDVQVVANQTTTLPQPTVLPQYWEVDVARLAGTDRYGTAARISQEAFPGVSSITDHPRTRPSIVYLASGLNFPDALAAGPAAINQGGGLLLTDPNTLSAATKTELQRLQPQKLVIVGSTGVVSNSVMNAAGTAAGVTPTRLGGADRYATASLIVSSAFEPASSGGSGYAVIATGRNYPDALGAGAGAGVTGAPVILVDGTASSLSSATTTLLRNLGTTHVVIVGSTGVVSSGIQSQLNATYTAANVVRTAGANRYATATAFNEWVFQADDYGLIANGLNFADALAGASLAGQLAAPVFLTPPTCLGDSTGQGIDALHINGVYLLGGTGALSAAVAERQPCASGSSAKSPANVQTLQAMPANPFVASKSLAPHPENAKPQLKLGTAG